MVTKLGRMLTDHKGLQPIKSHDPLITWSCEITWQIEIISLLLQYLWPPNLARRWHSRKCSWCFNHVLFVGHVTWHILYISTSVRQMTIKHGKVVTFHEVLPPINSHKSLNISSQEVTRKTENIFLHYHSAYGYKTYQCCDIQQVALTNIFAWALNEVVMWGHVRKLIILSLHLQKTGEHQMRQGAYL